MLRRQLVRPTLCGLGCILEQEWDDADAVPRPRTVRFLARCPRHAALADVDADAAIIDESRRFNAVVAALQGFDGISAQINNGVLEISLPEGVVPPGLPLAGVRFV